MKIVYTYGAFDLLHPGHIRILRRAALLGDKLYVGVVSDEAIQELKGKDRPFMPLADRLLVVNSLKFVDHAIPQHKYDPTHELQNLGVKIDTLCKGDDWSEIPGSHWVQLQGGQLIKLPYSSKWSTSKLVEKIRCS